MGCSVSIPIPQAHAKHLLPSDRAPARHPEPEPVARPAKRDAEAEAKAKAKAEEAHVPREKPDREVHINPGYESNHVRARPDDIDAATAAENFASTPDLLAPTKLESRTPAKFWYRVFKPTHVGPDVSSKLQTEIEGTVCAVGGRYGIAMLAESAVDVLFVDQEDPAHKFIKLNTADTGAVGSQWPLKQLRLGYAMSHEVPGTDGEFPPPSDGTIDATWEGPKMAEGAMYCREPGSRHCLLSDGYLYHCCGNGEGLHLADGSASGWNWLEKDGRYDTLAKDPIECWLGFRSEAQCKKAVESVTMDLLEINSLDRLSAKEGLEIVRTGEIDTQLATLVDTKPLITKMDIEPGNKPPGVTKAVVYRDKDTKRLTINYGVAGVRRKAGTSGCSHFQLDPATKTLNGKIWTRIWHYDVGRGPDAATGVWDMAAQDIAAFVKETRPTQVHIESGEDEYVTSKPGTGQWLIDNLRNGLALSSPPSNLSPDGKIEGELLDKTWEGPKKDAMRVPVKSPMSNSYSCLYHANYNSDGLALWPDLRGCNWEWNPDEVKEGKQIEVWLDAAVPQSGLKGTSLGQEVTPDDMFCWGSNSKALGATIAAIVISEGLLSWQSTIASVFADDKDIMEKMDEWYKFITVEMFLSMTHGCSFPGTPSVCYLSDDSKVKDDKAYMECSRAYVLEYCQHKPNMEKFGKFSYTSSGCAIVGGMIAKVCGKPWARVVKEKFWDKLLVDRGDNERKALFRYTPFADRNSATEFPFDRLRGPGDCEKYVRVKGAKNAGPEGVVWGHHEVQCEHLNGENGVGFAGPEPGSEQERPDVYHPLCGSYMATGVVFAHFCAWHASWAYANATTGVRKADYERMHNPMKGRCNGIDVDSGDYGMCVGSSRSIGHAGSTGNMQSCFHVIPDYGFSWMTNSFHGSDTDSGTGYCFLNNGGRTDDHPDSNQVIWKRHISPREFNAAKIDEKRTKVGVKTRSE